MSSNETRDAILAAALRVLEERRGAPWSMEDVARAAGVSRQAVYLHFAGKGELVVQAAAFGNAKLGMTQGLAPVGEAPSAVAALEAWLGFVASHTPKIARVARAIEAERVRDPEVESAWKGRADNRRTSARSIVARLADEGALAKGFTVDDATDLLWALTSVAFYDDLATRCDWSAARYVGRITALLTRGMVAPRAARSPVAARARRKAR